MNDLKTLTVRFYLWFLRHLRGFGRVNVRQLTLHSEGEFISDEIRRTAHHYELELLTRVASLVDPSSFLDVGANLGNHSNFFQQLGLSGMAFEPSPRNFRLLELNAAKFQSFNLALGSETGQATFLEYSDSSGNGHLKRAMTLSSEPDSRYEVPIRPLDSFELQGLSDPVLMKIDVEGSEMEVIRGARGFLSSRSPVIWIEVHEEETLRSAGINYSRREITSELVNLGYTHVRELNSTNFLYTNSRSASVSQRLELKAEAIQS